MVVSLLLCCLNFNHISGSLDLLDMCCKEKSRKVFHFQQLVIHYCRDEALKNCV